MEQSTWADIFKKIHDYHKEKETNPKKDYQIIRKLIQKRHNTDTQTNKGIGEDELKQYIQEHGSVTLKELFHTTSSEPTIQDQMDYLKNHIKFLNEIIEECRQTLNKVHL